MKTINRLEADAITAMPSVAPRRRVKNSGPSPSCIECAVAANHISTMPMTNSRSSTFQRKAAPSATSMGPKRLAVAAGAAGVPGAAGLATTTSDTRATPRPRSVTRPQAELGLRTKKGVSSTATIVATSHNSATNGLRSAQLGMKGACMRGGRLE